MDIKALKDKILQLAIQGKLVEQNTDDEPVKILLQRISEERDKLIKDKKAKGEISSADITDERKTFEIPSGWRWIRLGDLGITQTGTTPSTNIIEYFGGDIPFVKPADISSKGINYFNDSLTEKGLEKGRKIEGNSLIMVCIGGSIGKNYFTDRLCSCNQQINALTPLAGIKAKLVHYFVSSQFFYNNILEIATGTATPIIKKSNWEQLIIPLPPLEEQKRILAKIDELFNLVDELDDNKQELLQNIADSRNKILQLAIQGKLVEQMEDEESASNLLDKIRKGKLLSEINDEEKILEIPTKWQWVKLKDICEKFKYGSSAKSKEIGEVPVLRMGNIQNGKVDWKKLVYTSDEVEINKYDLVKGDLLFNRTNSPDLVGKTAIYEGERTAIYAGYLIRVRTLDGIDSEYINLFMNSKTAKDRCKAVKTDGVSQSNINAEKLGNFVIPLPPTNEQKRIVEKVYILMDYLDAIEKEIKSQKILIKQLT